MNNLTVENKSILITGAFGLVGKTISKYFLKNGAKVILADVDDSKMYAMHNEFRINAPEENFLITHVDISNKESCEMCVKNSLGKFGKIDVLINNAALDAKFDAENIGKTNQNRFENYPLDIFKRTLDINITGTVTITREAIKAMLQQGFGNIINVASVYALVAPNQSLYDFGNGNMHYKPVDYVISKSFIPNFTRYIATLYAKENIRCNAIVPHGVFNEHDEKFTINFSKLSPLGRMSEAEELTGPFLLLASDASSYMTGSVLLVDGGWTAW